MAKAFHLLMPLFVLPHSGSHSSHGLTSAMATINEGYRLSWKTESVPPQCTHVLQSTWCARPVFMQQPYRPGMTCLLD